MTQDEAEAIVTLYSKLMKELQDKSTEFTVPEPGFKITDVSLDADGHLEVKWSKYIGRGDCDYATTYPRLADYFKD